jgi:chitinase
MKYIVTAYAMDHSMPIINESDCRMWTHLNLAFGLVKEGRVSVSHLKHLGRVTAFKAWNPQLKILLSVGGWGAGGFSEAAMTQAGRELFAKTASDIVREVGLDGIDIDWEYPAMAKPELAGTRQTNKTSHCFCKHCAKRWTHWKGSGSS